MTETGKGKGATLPANRAFVVQFAAEPDDGASFRGRVEHLASGSVDHFDSLSGLGEFIQQVLGAHVGFRDT